MSTFDKTSNVDNIQIGGNLTTEEFRKIIKDTKLHSKQTWPVASAHKANQNDDLAQLLYFH